MSHERSIARAASRFGAPGIQPGAADELDGGALHA